MKIIHRNRIPRLMFYNHEVFPFGLWTNIALGWITPIYIEIFTLVLREGKLSGFWLYVYIWSCIMLMPNPAYLFLEIRHILLKDGIANDRPKLAVVIFSMIGMTGLISAVLTILIAVENIPFLHIHKFEAITGLSLLSAIGAVFGLLNFTSMIGFLLPIILIWPTIKILQSWRLSLLTMCLALILSSLVFLLELFR